MRARELMVANPRTVAEDLSAWAALAIMREEEIRHLPVVDGDRMVGILSNRDYRRILQRARPDGTVRGVFDVRVAEIMTPAHRVFVARPDATLRDLAHLIVSRKVGALPILDEGDRLVGIVTQKDVMAALLQCQAS